MKIIKIFDQNEIQSIDNRLIQEWQKGKSTDWKRTFFLRNLADGKTALISLNFFERFVCELQRIFCCKQGKLESVFKTKNFKIITHLDLKQAEKKVNDQAKLLQNLAEEKEVIVDPLLIDKKHDRQPAIEQKNLEAVPHPIQNEIEKLDLQLNLPPESALLEFGQFRKNMDGLEPPNFTTWADVIENEMLWSAALACCFHTAESQQEIWKLIKDSRIENDKNEYKKHNPLFPFTPKAYYTESYVRLYNNLCSLHNALPGDKKAKTAKIYWSGRVEETLFPYFFHNDHVRIDDLVFAITPGEQGISPFQGPEMDFTKQLQFVGIGKEKIMGDLKKDVEELSQDIFGKNILQEIENPHAEANHLITDANIFVLRNNLKNNLLTMKAENKKINFDVMAQEDRNKMIKKLISKL